MTTSEAEIRRAISRFVWAFDQVFQHDWPYTRAAICGAGFIEWDGTFVEPKVADEIDDWGHRGMLLKAYRELQKLMQQYAITPEWSPQ